MRKINLKIEKKGKYYAQNARIFNGTGEGGGAKCQSSVDLGQYRPDRVEDQLSKVANRSELYSYRCSRWCDGSDAMAKRLTLDWKAGQGLGAGRQLTRARLRQPKARIVVVVVSLIVQLLTLRRFTGRCNGHRT